VIWREEFRLSASTAERFKAHVFVATLRRCYGVFPRTTIRVTFPIDRRRNNKAPVPTLAAPLFAALCSSVPFHPRKPSPNPVRQLRFRIRGICWAATTLLWATVPIRVSGQSQPPAAGGTRANGWPVWDPTDSIGDIVVPVPRVPGLMQRVRLRPRAPRQGDTLYVASRLEYSGKDSVRLMTHTCGFELRADGNWLRFFTGDACMGYSQARWWKAGMDDLNYAVFVVTGQAGTHRAFVTELLNPPFAAPFDVTVRPPAHPRKK